jgi:hypothetical protein
MVLSCIEMQCKSNTIRIHCFELIVPSSNGLIKYAKMKTKYLLKFRSVSDFIEGFIFHFLKKKTIKYFIVGSFNFLVAFFATHH